MKNKFWSLAGCGLLTGGVGEGNGLQKQPNRDYTAHVTLEFLRQYLLQ